MQETWVWSLGWEDPLEEGNPFQYSCLENPHGQRSLKGYSQWGCKESDMTERLSADPVTVISFGSRILMYVMWVFFPCRWFAFAPAPSTGWAMTSSIATPSRSHQEWTRPHCLAHILPHCTPFSPCLPDSQGSYSSFRDLPGVCCPEVSLHHMKLLQLFKKIYFFKKRFTYIFGCSGSLLLCTGFV